MVKVTKTTADKRWGKNEHQFHFKCAKGGLEENDRAVNQLLAIVRSENNIGQEKYGQLSCLLKTMENRDSTVVSRGRYS